LNYFDHIEINLVPSLIKTLKALNSDAFKRATELAKDRLVEIHPTILQDYKKMTINEINDLLHRANLHKFMIQIKEHIIKTETTCLALSLLNCILQIQFQIDNPDTDLDFKPNGQNLLDFIEDIKQMINSPELKSYSFQASANTGTCNKDNYVTKFKDLMQNIGL
jgi:hypothetical protein